MLSITYCKIYLFLDRAKFKLLLRKKSNNNYNLLSSMLKPYCKKENTTNWMTGKNKNLVFYSSGG
jgi:hypothetical protein